MAPLQNRTRVPSRKARRWKRRAWGWLSDYGTGHGGNTISSGIEVTWTKTPALWSNGS